MDSFKMFELIDISSPIKWSDLNPGAESADMDAMKLLGERYKFNVLRTFGELRTLRETGYTTAEVQAARTNQLKWWKDRYEMFNEQEEAASSDEQLHGIRIARLPLRSNVHCCGNCPY
jgi:hypothetical protein